jgi:alpha-methylacyl-CoA racemase
LTPLEGLLVLDATRMLPGAVLARMLLEFGARLIKIEEPGAGDPLRGAPPLVDGIGAGFADFFHGAESLRLDLRVEADAARLRKLARSADVVVESFRPGAMEAWGVGPDRLLAANPSLVVCRLSGFGAQGDDARRIGHDLNVVASSGLLAMLGSLDIPRVQIADCTCGMLACAAVLGAMLGRARTGRGAIVDQPLASGPAPLLAWAAADAAAGGGGMTDTGGVLGGGCAAYGVYRCSDGLELVVAALEPKLWNGIVRMLELEGLADRGLQTGIPGRETIRTVAERFATRPREEWLAEGARRELPVSAVADLDRAAASRPLFPSLGRRPTRPSPALGQHDGAIWREFSLDQPVD